MPAFTPCPHFGICGGCSKQDRSYEVQLAEKQSRVHQALSAFSIPAHQPILHSPEVQFYRNKMEYSFGDSRDVALIERKKVTKEELAALGSSPENKNHLGLHPRKRFSVVAPTPECFLLSEDARIIMKTISDWSNRKKIPVYVRPTHSGVLRHTIIREGKNTGQRLVNLITFSSLDEVDSLAEELKTCGAVITTFIWTAYDGISDVAGGDAKKIFWGDGAIVERVGNLNVRVGSTSFMQTNTHASEAMIGLLGRWLVGLSREPRSGALFDLYCGAGVIGLNLSPHFSKVIGIEIDSKAVEHARLTATNNGITNSEFVAGRTEDLMTIVSDHRLGKDDVVVVDPPRAGLHSKVIDALLQMEIPNIFYVSCNPDSLARDLGLLTTKYTIDEVQPMDFFPHTDHVETAVRLTYGTLLPSKS